MEIAKKETIQKIKEDAGFVFNHRDDCGNKNSRVPIDECSCDCYELWWLKKGAELFAKEVVEDLSNSNILALTERLEQLSTAVTKGKVGLDREFYMSIPARPLNDADLVLSRVSVMLKKFLKVLL